MILVVGATGLLGGKITRQLLEKGKQVRILVREGSDHQALVDAGAEPVFGDLKHCASLDRAMQGVDTVLTTANSAARGGEDNVQTVEIEGNRNLIDAARDAGVQHFIFTSAMGADVNSPVPFLQGKGMTEEHLRASGMTYTILSPNIFMEVWIGMIVGMPPQIFIGGPEAVSWNEIVEWTSPVVGREVPVRHVAPGEPIPGLPDTVAQLAASMDSYDSPLEMTETYRTFGIQPTSVDTLLGRMFGGAPMAPVTTN